jgi:hypothetical protein
MLTRTLQSTDTGPDQANHGYIVTGHDMSGKQGLFFPKVTVPLSEFPQLSHRKFVVMCLCATMHTTELA